VPGEMETTTNSELQMPAQPVPTEQVNQYASICRRLNLLSEREQQLLMQYTENSTPVINYRAEISEVEKLKRKLEEDYPGLLARKVVPVSHTTTASDPEPEIDERTHVSRLNSRVDLLRRTLKQVQDRTAKVEKMEGTILGLQRKKDLEDADLRYFSANLEQAQMDEALGIGKAPNIGIIDPPTPAVQARPKTFKKKLGIAVMAPVMCGIGLAFLIELFLDMSVKRPLEVEKKLGLPLFMSIPDVARNGRRRLRGPEKRGDAAVDSTGLPGKTSGMEMAVWEFDHPLRQFYEGLRDRLMVHFETRNLIHKPKLVAVTSCGKNAGVTSTAAGLAASLSKTREGNVLLVDMNSEQGVTQEYFKGKPSRELEDALERGPSKNSMVQTNLYVAAERVDDDKLPRILRKRFTQLMPKFRASEYDYIIFDMPPVGQTSVTARVAGLMDMVLLVVESEKTNREIVKQASSLLKESKADVGVVLNKTRTYVPASLHQEHLSD
jgi:polysaccharide biosynthesis transport protein